MKINLSLKGNSKEDRKTWGIPLIEKEGIEAVKRPEILPSTDESKNTEEVHRVIPQEVESSDMPAKIVAKPAKRRIVLRLKKTGGAERESAHQEVKETVTEIAKELPETVKEEPPSSMHPSHRIMLRLKKKGAAEAKKDEEGNEEIIEIVEGIKIPEIKTTMERIEHETELIRADIRYPLGESCSAHIMFDKNINEMVYHIEEPKIDESQKILLMEIKNYIQEKIDMDFAQLRKKDALDYIIKIFDKALDYFKVKYDETTRTTLKYYLMRDFIGLERIEPIISDKRIEDISCDGVGINVYVYHRDPRLGSMKTNVVFNDKDDLDSFVNKLAERCGRSISIAKPLFDGTLPDGSRVQATLGSDIARRGSNFTIRMFTEAPLTPVDLIKLGTFDLKMMAYYWFLVEHGASILISGGTATGKTSVLNALSLFIKPQMKIVSIEDTAELRLPHLHWVPEVARTPLSEVGKVDMYELLRVSLRQRPDYIIVGEVRGKEAYVLFQQMAIGHAGLSTIHAENFPRLVDRLTSPPISLPVNLLENLDTIIFLKLIKHGKVYMRRVITSLEVARYNEKTKNLEKNDIFRWNPRKDSYETLNRSVILKKISDTTGTDEKDIRSEIEKRAKVIEWMIKQNITDYRKIGVIINMFYTSPDALLERIEQL
ncbi:MAG: type II/IV secretion system ATPase subunit [Candidatus Aenigmatarchaeota archaeon]